MIYNHNGERHILTSDQYELLKSINTLGYEQVWQNVPPRGRGSVRGALKRLRDSGFLTDAPHELTPLGKSLFSTG